MSDHAQQPPRPNDRLRELRVRSGLSQRELARRAGVAGNTILNAERGTAVPSGALQAKIATALSRALATATVLQALEHALDGGELVRADELWPDSLDDELEAIAA